MAKTDKKLKKLTVEKIDLAKMEPGFEFEGKFCGTTQSEPFQDVDKKTGEVITRTLTFAVFERNDGTRFKVIQDSGLRSCLTDAMVKEGDAVMVVKLAKTQLPKGRTLNQYDIYAL